MDDIHTLAAEPKERAGKGAARAARRAGRIPGVIYGAKKSPVMITLDPQEVHREIRGGGFFTTLFDIKVNGGSERVLAAEQSIQFIAPAFEGPFVAAASVLSRSDEDLLCLVELRDSRGDAPRSMSTFRMRILS